MFIEQVEIPEDLRSDYEAVVTAALFGRSADARERARQCAAYIRRIAIVEAALIKIRAIENKLTGGDWDEIEEARSLANDAIEDSRGKEGQ